MSTEKVSRTKSQEIAAEIAALLRARSPLLWIVTREEARAERYLIEAAAAAGYVPRMWDAAQGVTDISGRGETMGSADIGEMLGYIANRSGGERAVWIMRDLPGWISGPVNILALRQLRNLARSLPGLARADAQALIVLSPSGEVPAELANHATVIEWPMPDRSEIASILDAAIESLPEFHSKRENGNLVPDTSRPLRALAAPNGVREAGIDAAVGLSGEEAQHCYAKSLVQMQRIDPATVAKEKRRVIARERVLEWFDPLPGGLEAVGGLENLKAWLVARKLAYSAKARAYGLPAPKGCLLGGISGCGKSLTAKAIATALGGVPLLKVDLGALKSKFVGESEGNLRRAFALIESVGRCVVWFDEIEKSLQGATSGASDGGVSSDALGAVLTWMQERRGEAFVIATANDVEALPAELLRKGRFDEIWWIDLPTATERVAILQTAMRQHGRADILQPAEESRIAAECETFTGSEIAALVPDALFRAFADNREVNMVDLLQAAATVVPLAKTAAERITKLRNWANGRARPASIAAPVSVGTAPSKRELDV